VLTDPIKLKQGSTESANIFIPDSWEVIKTGSFVSVRILDFKNGIVFKFQNSVKKRMGLKKFAKIIVI
jgi:hypothetical protein